MKKESRSLFLLSKKVQLQNRMPRFIILKKLLNDTIRK